MQTEAIFENIAERIQTEIGKAQKSIFIAVAWFANKNIFDQLLKKASAGCSVSLIISNDEINTNSKIDFDQLKKYSGKCYKIGNVDTTLMHNKFCVIDYSTVITGSYNWSYKAEHNFENVIITNNNTVLAEQFIAEFNQMLKRAFPNEIKEDIIFPLAKIIKRLQILKNYIELEDVEELTKESSKLKEFNFNTDLSDIIEAIKQQEFALAITKIQTFITQNQQLAIWNDPEIGALKLEIKNLENQLNAFDNEKIELEKLLSDFQHRHTIELGNIVLEILKLRKLKFKTDKAKQEEAENDFKNYSKQIAAEKEKKQFEITPEERQELKRKFRKATFLCHPDKVSEEFTEAAQKIFIEIKAAYEANDLKAVTNILADLEKGNYFKSQSDTVSEKEKLKAAIAKLRKQIKDLETEITIIKTSETYKTVSSISDWDAYFNETKEQLEKELEELQLEVEV